MTSSDIYTLDRLEAEINDNLQQQFVTHRRIAGNTIIMYFFEEPGDPNVSSVWINPTWRYQKQGKIILGSYDLGIESSDFESEEDYEQAFHSRCDLVGDLFETQLLEIKIDRDSSDITMFFSGDRILRNFANSAFDREEMWVYRNMTRDLCVYVSPSQLRVKKISDIKAHRQNQST